MGKQLLIFLVIASLGGLFIYGGYDCYLDSRRPPEQIAFNSSRADSPSPLLLIPTLFLCGVIAILIALYAISPDTELADGYFWAHASRGIPLILASLVSLLLPPLFLWQAWILLTEDLLKGHPPIAWGRIGGVTSDWVLFVAMFIPWLILALAGIISPPIYFWKGLFKR